MVVSSHDPNHIIAGEHPLVHQPVTIAEGQNLKRGAVLGRVTSGGKHILSASAASDGSQTPKCILAEDVDATDDDVVGPAYFSGEFAQEELTYGTGHTATTVEAAFRAASAPLYLKSIGPAA